MGTWVTPPPSLAQPRALPSNPGMQRRRKGPLHLPRAKAKRLQGEEEAPTECVTWGPQGTNLLLPEARGARQSTRPS